MTEKSNEQPVRALIGAAFHEGTLEHRDSPSNATLKKARDAVEQAKAAVLARMCGPGEVVVQGWQPIETAPTDGTWIAAWRKHATRMRMLRWNGDYDAWEDDDGILIYDVTYWMPLLARPQGEGK